MINIIGAEWEVYEIIVFCSFFLPLTLVRVDFSQGRLLHRAILDNKLLGFIFFLGRWFRSVQNVFASRDMSLGDHLRRKYERLEIQERGSNRYLRGANFLEQ